MKFSEAIVAAKSEASRPVNAADGREALRFGIGDQTLRWGVMLCKTSRQRLRFRLPLAFAAFVTVSALLPVEPRAADRVAEVVTPVFSQRLPNVPGKSMTGLLVTYPPGGRSTQHRHAGSVIAYVLSGAVRSENSATGAARIYKTGESFFEPPGSMHLISENASATESASLLAVFVADDGATLKTDEP